MPAKYGDSKFSESVKLDSAHVYVNDTQVPTIYNVPLFGVVRADGGDIVFTDIDGNLIPSWKLSITGGYQTIYKDPIQDTATGGTVVYRQWGGPTVNVPNDPTLWTGNYGGAINHELRYPMDSTSGVEVDSAENFDGTVAGADRGQTAQINNGMLFVRADGNNVISNAAAGNFEHTQAFSLSFWIKFASLANDFDIISRNLGAGTYRGWFLKFSLAKVLEFQIINTTGTENIVVYLDFPAVAINTWYHIAATYDGSGVGAGMAGYVDKTVMPPTVITDNLAGLTTLNAAPFNVGARNSAGQWADAAIDELRVIKGALSQNQVRGLYDNQFGYSTNDSLIIGDTKEFGGMLYKSTLNTGINMSM